MPRWPVSGPSGYCLLASNPATIYHYSLRNIPKEHSSHLHPEKKAWNHARCTTFPKYHGGIYKNGQENRIVFTARSWKDSSIHKSIKFEPIFYWRSLNHFFNSLNPELNPMCYLLALLAHHFFHVSRIRVKSLTLRLLISYIYIYGAPILDVSRSHTTTQHSR